MEEIIETLCDRYLNIIREYEAYGHVDLLQHDERLCLDNLAWMCQSMRYGISGFPEDKANRWIGFIQGCLAMRGMIDVDEERDFTRPLFHEYYGKNAPSFERKA